MDDGISNHMITDPTPCLKVFYVNLEPGVGFQFAPVKELVQNEGFLLAITGIGKNFVNMFV